jgi:hypothetical protein
MTDKPPRDLLEELFRTIAQDCQRRWRMANPWDPAPKEPKGDDDPNDVYRAVGVALIQWEQLEEALASLLGVIIDSDTRSTKLAYGTVAAGAARLNMIVAAAGADRRIDEATFEELWRLIDAEIGRLSVRRNEIAHGQVTHMCNGGSPDDGPAEPEGHYLVPPFYDTRKQHSFRNDAASSKAFGHVRYAYTSEQIAHYALQFHLSAERVRDMGMRVTVIHLDAQKKQP